MAKEISFIHAADLHLDSLFTGLTHTPEHIFREIRESTFHALDHLIQTAIEKSVDFVLIVGDLFDNEKQNLKAQIRLKKAFEMLQRYKINVYISYGNHDFINGNIHPVTYPDNVYIFPDEKVKHFIYEKDEEALAAIYGFSYENRAVTTKKADEYEIQHENIPYHIATLHGSLKSNTAHDVYAPFQINDLMEKDFSYWALGHIHHREILKVNPPIVYSGNIQGRNRKETGEKGCYHVVMTGEDVEMSFIPLQTIQFRAITVDVSNCEEVHELESAIQSTLETIDNSISQLLDLTLVSDNPILKQWESEQHLEDIIELVNETNTYQQNWSYIFRLTVQSRISEKESQLYKGDHFIGVLSRHFDETSIKPFIKELYQQKTARKFIDPLVVEEEQEIKSDAKYLLLNELLKEGGD